jgi:hypothetical protein
VQARAYDLAQRALPLLLLLLLLVFGGFLYYM